MMHTRNRSQHELIAFFAWTLGLTYLVCWGPLALFRIPGATAGGQAGPGAGLLPFIAGGFIPSFVGIALTGYTEGRPGLGRLWRRAVAFRFPGRWYLTTLLICLAVGGARLAVQWLLHAQIEPSEVLSQMAASPVLWVAFAIQILFLGPLSEEFGWRGYAQERVLARFSPLTGSLVLGIVWAFWHLPLFFIPGTAQSAAGQPLLQFAVFAVQVICLTVIITWLYNRTGCSLGAAVLMHFLTNFVGTVVTYLLVPSLLDAAVQTVGYLVAAVLIVALGGRRLGARADSRQAA